MGRAPDCCPTCGGAISIKRKPIVDLDRSTIAWGGRLLRVQRKEAELLYILAEAWPAVVATPRIIMRLYGAGGGPLTNTINVMVSHLRRRMTPELGVSITTHLHVGYSLAFTAEK